MSIMNEWETVSSTKRLDSVGSDTTQRLRIEGAWLYRTVLVEEHAYERLATTIALCFVPEQK